jgi:hypothetical protein
MIFHNYKLILHIGFWNYFSKNMKTILLLKKFSNLFQKSNYMIIIF